MESEQEEKQTYLREQIIDQNYEPESFVEFLKQKKGEEAGDINNWTLEELKSVVEEFKNSNKSPKIHNEAPPAEINHPTNDKANNNEQTPFPLSNLNKNNDDKKNNFYVNEETKNEWLFMRPSINMDISNDYKKEEINEGPYEIECLEPDNTPLSKYENINLKITKYEKVTETTGILSLFKKTYFTFWIECTPLKINIRRKYSDFEWLRNTLIKIYPGNYIPPLPIRTLNINSNEKKLEKYQRFLEKFMNELMEDELIKNSSILYIFLFTNKPEDFDSIMQKYNKQEIPTKLCNFYSRDGKIILDDKILLKTKELFDIKSNISKMNEIYINMKKSFNSLFKEMRQVSDRFIEISNYFKNIYNLSIMNSENENICKSYLNLELTFKQYSNIELQNIENFSIELKEYLKYMNMKYIISFKELFDGFEQKQNLYIKVAQQLSDKKEILYNSGNINAWEIDENDKTVDLTKKEHIIAKMLPKETAIVNEIKKHLIYYATQLYNENKREKLINEKQNKLMYKRLKEKCCKVVEETNQFWKLIILDENENNIN